MPSRLANQISTIKDDYAQQIKAVKQDKTLTHKERRARIRELKSERDATVIQARKDYFFNSQRGANQPPTYNGNQQPGNQQPGNQPNNNNNAKPQSNGNNSQQNSNEQPEYSDKTGS